jgi:hypothetical protein
MRRMSTSSGSNVTRNVWRRSKSLGLGCQLCVRVLESIQTRTGRCCLRDSLTVRPSRSSSGTTASLTQAAALRCTSRATDSGRCTIAARCATCVVASSTSAAAGGALLSTSRTGNTRSLRSTSLRGRSKFAEAGVFAMHACFRSMTSMRPSALSTRSSCSVTISASSRTPQRRPVSFAAYTD